MVIYIRVGVKGRLIVAIHNQVFLLTGQGHIVSRNLVKGIVGDIGENGIVLYLFLFSDKS